MCNTRHLMLLARWWLTAVLALTMLNGWAAPPTRAQALAALADADPDTRAAALERLAEVGTMQDAQTVLARLSDPHPRVRDAAGDAVWHIWSRSGDEDIDALLAQGVRQMQQAALHDALTTFDEIIRRKPAFAEGWNKRATVLFLLGEDARSLKDCEEVFRRNPDHFGALSGAGQIHLRLGNPRRALDYFRRALAVNPNLEGLQQVIPAIERKLEEDERHRT